MRFLGTGSGVPQGVLTNEKLSTMVDTSDEWITARTGIKERRVAEDETLLDLSLAAARKALAVAETTEGFSPEQIDLVICATLSSQVRCPSLACCLQRDLGLKEEILAFDLNAACSGFTYALIVASRFIAEGKTALLLGGELLSPLIDFSDRSTCILFGDGAGAAVVAPSAHAAASEFFWAAETQGNDEVIHIKDTIFMDGPSVFEFAVRVLIRNIRKVAEKAQLDLADIDHVICHQANERIIKSAAKRLGIPLEKFFMNLSRYGNTSAASIPLALDEAVQTGVIKPGAKVMMAGFGGGLTAGAVYFIWE